jgi:membrane associated rhomboid family serine protease
MASAPVGYQCPECVAAGAATVRQARTVFGGRVSRDGAVTMTIIGVCVGLFVTVSLLGLFGGLLRWGMYPAAIALADEWYRLVTSVFLHSGWLHIAFNMYVLFLLGPPLERLLGHGRFFTLFLVSGIGGSVASYAFSPLRTLSVGASGAIFGLMAAWIVISRRLDRDATQVVALLGINVVLGFVLPGIDWRAHLGGALTGALVALALTTGRGQQARQRVGQQVLVTALIVGALVAVVLWRTEQIQQLIPV